MRKKPEIVIVKLQRPLFTNGDMNMVLSYIVDEDGNQTSNPVEEVMSEKDIEYLFGDEYKVYWEAEYRKGKNLVLLEPIEDYEE